ncbi:MAG TPA: energy transducer TonB [Flavobacterium sp.]|nr:energy transducer TonB [Flavobacterium sp.]
MKQLFTLFLLLFNLVIFGQETKPSEDEKEDNNIYYLAAVQKMPQPKDGHSSLGLYLAKNFNFTPEAIKQNIKGRIFLEFIVEKDGRLTDFKILKGLGYGLDEEAIRVLSNHENWIPGEYEGKKVRVRFNIPIALRSTN